MFKRKIKRSDWMQGLLDCEESMSIQPPVSVDSKKRDIDACINLYLMLSEHYDHTLDRYKGMLDYLDHYEKVIKQEN